MGKLNKFISWNEALVDYFVRNGSTVWFVTDSVIDHIGNKYGIVKDDDATFCDDFKNSVLFVKRRNSISADAFFEDRICLSSTTLQAIEKEVPDKVEIPKRIEVNTLIDFALFLCGNKFYYLVKDELSKKYDLNNKKYLGDYLYFSYIIFILWGYNQYGNQRWSGVKELFCSNSLQFRDNTDPSKIASLFNIAIKDELLNNNCVRTDLVYIKYLKYHSVLTPGKRDVFEGVLYDHNIAFSEDIKYNDIRNWIWRVASKTSLKGFENELLDNANRQYFETVIKNFDREEYREKKLNTQSRQTNGAERLDGRFRFVVDAETQSLSVWVEGINVNQVLRNGNIKITPNYILPDNYIADVTNLSWGRYVQSGLQYRESGICIKSASARSCYYFEIVNNRWLVEVVEPDRLANRQCLFATIGENEDLVIRHNAHEVKDPVLRFFLPTDWHLYVTSSYVLGTIDEDEAVKVSLDAQTKFARVAIDDAIRVNVNGKLCFVAEMFPYIIFEGIDYENIKIKAFDSIDKHPINFKQKNIGEKIYLYDIGIVQSGEMILEIYDEQNNRIDYNVKEKSHFLIRSACDIQAYNDKEYVKFDKWFCMTNEESNYYSNNRIYPLANTDISWEPTTQQPVQSEHQRYSRLMAVLYALGETREHNGQKAIPNTVLESALKYEADFSEISLDKFQIYRLKNALCDLGVLTHYYDGGHYYQTNSACLIPTGKKYLKNALDNNDNGTLFYILSGAYSRTYYEMIINRAECVEYVQQQDLLYSLLPSIVKVGFKDRDEHSLSIPVNNDCTYVSLLGFAGNISEFDGITAFTDNIIGSTDNCVENVPCIIPCIDYRGKREQLRIDNERILVNPNIPLSILRNYVSYKHNNPLWFESRKGEIFIKEEKAIPFFAKRALNSFSGNLSKEVYVFGVDNIIGNGENHLFERLITYVLPTGGAKTNVLNLLKNVLGGKNANIKSVYVPSDIMSNDIKLEYGGFKYLKMFACKKEKAGINKWWLELLCGGKVICYTDPDTREVYCAHDDQFKRINLNDKSINSIVSNVIKIYDEKYNFTVQEFYPDYGISIDNTDVCQNYPSCETEATKYEIIILKSYEK